MKVREFTQNQLTPVISSQTGCTELKVSQPVRQLMPKKKRPSRDNQNFGEKAEAFVGIRSIAAERFVER